MSAPAAPALYGIFQTGPPPTSLSQGLAMIIDGVCRVVAGRSARERALTPMLVLLWTRLRRMAARFERLAARVRAGGLPAAPVREPSAATRHPAARAQRPPPAVRLPRGFAWLIRLMPEAAAYRSQLEYMLGDPEMAALLSAEPKLRRLLRPVCRMLAICPSPELLAPSPAPPRRVGPACGTQASGTPASGMPPSNTPPSNTPASGTPASGKRPPDTPSCAPYATDVRPAVSLVSERSARSRRRSPAPARDCRA